MASPTKESDANLMLPDALTPGADGDAGTVASYGAVSMDTYGAEVSSHTPTVAVPKSEC